MFAGAPDTFGALPRRRAAGSRRLGPVILATVLAAAVPPVSALAQLVAGPNINMLGGPTSATLAGSPPYVTSISGDPFLQRQNEPSIACSSRNPLNCLAAANDYRLVLDSGTADSKVLGNTWLGVYWTRDGGTTWRSTMLPGFPHDASGTPSPLTGFGAASDPTVRAGTNGLFYLSGVVFQPQNEPSAGSGPGGGGEPGQMFVSLFVDDNNSQAADTPIRHVRTVIVDNGNNGQFLDKPWVAVDIPRKGAGTCTIPGAGGVADQTVPAGVVYVAYSVFLGSGNNPHSKILFTKSADCGQTWATPVKLDESYATDQSAQIALNPLTGDILVAWRNFGTTNLSSPNQILAAKSTDGGKTFKTVQVANLGLVNATTAYDQPTAPTAANPGQRMFRSNGYPSACVDSTGRYWLAWSAWSNLQSASFAQVLVSTSLDGATWTTGQALEANLGHQLMPSIACAGNTATILWYDQRDDPLLNAALTQLIFDLVPATGSALLDPHTLDVRARRGTTVTTTVNGVQTTTLSFPEPSVRVSRYSYGLVNTSTGWKLQQLEINPVNWPLFSGGTIPFIGDYLDLIPVRVFAPTMTKPYATATPPYWAFNSDTSDGAVLQAAWTDNRDIPRQPSDLWGYTSPTTTACTASLTDPPKYSLFTRNQNVYTSRLAPGLIVGVPGNSRGVATALFTRAYAVTIQNTTNALHHLQLTFGAAPYGTAWFDSGKTKSQLDADVGPQSTIARTVFVDSTQTSPVLVQVKEVDASDTPLPNGLTGSALINLDSTAPPPLDGSLSTGETYAAALSDTVSISSSLNPGSVDVLNPTYLNPTYLNPTYLNATPENPTYLNPTYLNPTYLNPTYLNPTYLNPTYLNPTYLNTSPTVDTYTTDVIWTVTNQGTTATAYNFSAVLSSLSGPYQLIVNKVYETPSANACGSIGAQFNALFLNRIDSPPPGTATNGNPSDAVTNTTFALAKGETALVVLRLQLAQQPDEAVLAKQVAAVVVSQPGTAKAVYDLLPPVIAAHADLTVAAVDASGATVVYTAPAVTDNLDPTSLATCSPASGTLFPIGTTTVTCKATDAAGNAAVPTTFLVTVADTTAPVFTTTAPNIGPVSATTLQGAVVTFTSPSATDNVDGTIPSVCTPASGSTFAIGTTQVTCTATDKGGNTATTSFTVTVVSSATATASPNTLLWSPNKTLTPVKVSGVFYAPLPISYAGTTSLAGYSVIDEYGTWQPSGTVSVDATGAYTFTVNLEAWRQGSDANGRVYTITVSGTDAQGKVVTATTTVLVPHNQ